MAKRAAISIRGCVYERLAAYCMVMDIPLSTFVESAIADKHPPDEAGQASHQAVVGPVVETLQRALRQQIKHLGAEVFAATSSGETTLAAQYQRRVELARARLARLDLVRGQPDSLGKILAQMVTE